METAFLIAFGIALLGLIVLIIGTASYLLRKSNNIDADLEELEQAQVSAVNQDIVEFVEPEPVAEVVNPVKPKAKRKAAKKKAVKKTTKKG